jgi:hypothetical protein
MRLLATFAAVATVNAFLDDSDILLRSRRQAGDDDEGCGEGYVPTVDGLCAEDSALAQEIAGMYDDDDEPTNPNLRKFPMGSSQGAQGETGFFDSGLERTKRRSQRMTLLLAKVTAGGTLVDKDGKKIRSKEFINRVNQYGCHCWPSERKEHLTGYGKALDSIDESCFVLKQCHKCIGIDYPENDSRPQGCDPVTTKYKAKISRDGSNGLSITCANTLNAKGTNNGDCKRSLCECDKAFADSFATNFADWSSDTWQLEQNGNYDEMCVRNSRGARALGTGPDSCCGNYPNIKAYNSATHSCVDGVVTSDNL